MARCESQDDRAILKTCSWVITPCWRGSLPSAFYSLNRCYTGTMLGLAGVKSRPQVISQVRDVGSAKLQEPPRSAVIHGEQPR